ncbi:16S rRNA (guanine(527)-N(7))-methyltransferase RsmG [Methylophilaceae bacterium]|nr:16S rRNA (guanine(527)-N(7))-methyltransferase RsmG [Methylophilaceae bacterium]
MLDLEDTLKLGIEKLELENKAYLYNKLLIYKDLLIKWNKVFNLISLKATEEIVTHHFLDCLAVVPYIEGKNILDVGSGAGMPGIIIGLCCPEKQITLVDSVGKKTAFLKQTCAELKLSNITVINKRVEDITTNKLFDSIIARAFSDMQMLIDLTKHLIENKGTWYGMKSKKINEEEINTKYVLEKRVILVPYLDAERYLVKINNQ